MARLVQALLSLFSGYKGQRRSLASKTADVAGNGSTGQSLSESQDLAPEVERLHAWLMGRQGIDHGEHSIPERAMLTELRHRIRDRRLSQIPLQPRVLPLLIRALGDERQSHRDIASIIVDEPALTDELLRVVNRSRGQSIDAHSIESVEQAVLMVGFEGVRRAVSEAVMRPVMQSASRPGAGFARNVWHWGLLCANACDLLGQQQRDVGSDLFMIGLMPSLAYLSIYRELESIAQDQSGNQPVPPPVLSEALYRETGRMLERLVGAWQLPSRYGDHLRELHETPLGCARSTLSRGMILGTGEALRGAGRRTLLQKELVTVTDLEHRQLEHVQAGLKRA
ncbi:HDOD domain-containing protein [Salicola sp. Rm-C-2C1-2]|uniref:HDOD domain-containing protein n=1 Tax=Salicola sp. Rm-C-2C1-2 TaxID=3141321 RepID=UPI0032E4F42E